MSFEKIFDRADIGLIWAQLGQAMATGNTVLPGHRSWAVRRTGLTGKRSLSHLEAISLAAHLATVMKFRWAHKVAVKPGRGYRRKLDDEKLGSLLKTLGFWSGTRSDEVGVLIDGWARMFGVKDPRTATVSSAEVGGLIAAAIDYGVANLTGSVAQIESTVESVYFDGVDEANLRNKKRRYRRIKQRFELEERVHLVFADRLGFTDQRSPSSGTERMERVCDLVRSRMVSDGPD